MFLEQNEQDIRVFLAGVTHELERDKNRLTAILESAGMQITQADAVNDPYRALSNTDCSLHLLGNNYSNTLEAHLDLARKYNQENGKFKIFIWQPPHYEIAGMDIQQEKFINSVRNSIYRNMIFSKHESSVMLAEDMRSIMYEEVETNFNIKPADIFFIFNEIDEDAVKGITSIIDDVADVQTLNIILNNSVDYAQMVAQQMEKSKLTVIFFKRSVNWALPFAQQIWKKIGGASSGSKILLIGDGNHEQNADAKFDAPNVTSIIVPEELLPLEIKVQFDKLTSSKD